MLAGIKEMKMNDVLSHDSVRLYWAGANEMNFVMNHAPGAGSIARPVDQQSSALPLYHRSPLLKKRKISINPV